MLQNKKFGFSLVELVIVLAISSMLLVMVGGFYAQRRTVASDDAIRQMISSIQTVQTEARTNLGPTNGAVFAPGDTFFGEAIEFSNDGCGDVSCIVVHKLKANATNTIISKYETYNITNSQNLQYFVGSGECSDTTFVSCFTFNSGTSSISNFASYFVVFKSGSGDPVYLDKTASGCGGPSYAKSCFTQNGKLQQAVSSESETAGNRYLLKIDMAGGGNLTYTKL